MATARVITSAKNEYSALLRSHSRIASPWYPVSASQLARRACQEPKERGLLWTSWSSVLVAASTSQSTGSTKKTTNSASTSVGSGLRGRRRVRARVRGRVPAVAGGVRVCAGAVSVGIEESGSGDEQRGGDQSEQQQFDGDGGGGVDVVVLEREVVRELVERVVAPRDPDARLGEQLGFDEQLRAAGEGEDRHVDDPFAQQRDLDVKGGLPRARAVDARGLDDVERDVVQRPVHHHDPAARAGPERDQCEQHRQMTGGDDIAEGLVAQRAQQEADRTHA